METTRSGPLFIFRILASNHISTLRLEADVESDAGWFWWPNHEGERGVLKDVHSRLGSAENRNRGISVIYPVTASCRTLIIGDREGGIILSAIPDEKGRISRINVKSPQSGRAVFTVKTGRSCWLLTRFSGEPEDALNWFSQIIHKVKWPLMEPPEPVGRNLLQVGLIGPDYDCLVPVEAGFGVLGDIAAVMKKHLGPDNWLHVFGYSHGHDILYPDYTPSAYLGGSERLKDAIKAVHRQRQKVSFYMNIRMGDQNLIENEFSLRDSVFGDSVGKAVIEKAHDRAFLVMDPHSKPWQDRLVREAEHLVSLGADALELNHRGSQSLLVPLGEQWGEGIRQIITRIRDLGVKVWYRGGTDIYPADWLEMSSEELRMEDDGTIISGCTLGECDPRLFMTLVPGRTYMLPLSRNGHHKFTSDAGEMRDLENIMGGLFIYNEEYMDRIEMIMKRVAEEDEQERQRQAAEEAGAEEAAAKEPEGEPSGDSETEAAADELPGSLDFSVEETPEEDSAGESFPGTADAPGDREEQEEPVSG